MSEFDPTNTFTLGKGDKDKPEHKDKDTSKWPDYKGFLNVEGKEYYLSAWIKKNGETGEKFFSGALKAKEDSGNQDSGHSPADASQDPDDDIPF
jgi:hypothetical protein